MSISASLTRVKHVRITRDNRIDGDWLIRVPGHVFKALNKSIVGTGVYGGSLYGTSFSHNTSIAVHMVGGGTSDGGTAYGVFLGTGRT